MSSEEEQTNSQKALIEARWSQSRPKMYKWTGFVDEDRKLIGVVKRRPRESGPVTRRFRLSVVGCA